MIYENQISISLPEFWNIFDFPSLMNIAVVTAGLKSAPDLLPHRQVATNKAKPMASGGQAPL